MMEVLASILLAAFFYVVILVCYKIMGKRELNQLGAVDVVINILIANIAASGIVEESFWVDSFGGVVMIVTLQVLMSKIQLHKTKVRDIVDGEPSLIIKNGRIDYSELGKIRIDLDDFIMLLRTQGVVNPEDVQYAIIEKNGKLIVFEKKLPTKVFPLPLIVSGSIKEKALQSFGQSKQWLKDTLRKHEVTNLNEIDYLFYEEHKFIIYTRQGMNKIKINEL
ncbi:MAG: DUF421 domain-containing protein [Turicibacter sanguinis]|uniref:DUF421 domain-containing protein n=2 Tax=Turicibacter sanguinis TaxID=154288 RepID=A0A9X4XDZ1_9FIRM|nr:MULTISPECIES: YetF domain-containing protein [Turicibacter]KAB6699894.1 DUF421 domain-containing protein [Phocaeicola vulgatus]EFF63427.1 conserved hypothetical protein [Turicibacter sanguinis PC909]EGC92031.1 hypothetical protein HMPREF9402_1883 [Turicibacter sp. HGF1]MCU7191893.1 DUF421 domain-containing protein [Turicibacter sanguinis]MCU7198123.1 DUF421 domain-containing protein [Turicibacter sanguinis]